MLYLIDANVLIDADRDYYPMDRVPEFWEWLLHMGEKGNIKMPEEIREEIAIAQRGELPKRVRTEKFKNALVLKEEPEPHLVDQSVRQGYAHDLTDREVENLGNDPFLIAYALRDPSNRCIVTTEVSKAKRQRANRHLPDASEALGIQTYNTFEMTRRLDFRTNWKLRLPRQTSE